MPFVLIEDRAQRVWQPNARQEKFASIPDTVLEVLFGGAAGGGKSEILLVLPILKGWIHKSNFRGIIFRRTFPQLEESLIPRSRELYKPVGGKYNETKHHWTFPSGAMIFLSYMQRDEDARDHDTAEYNYVGFDELTHFSWYQYSYIVFSRIRGDITVARAGTNPGNIGHVWVRDRFVKPAPQGGVLLRDKNSGQLRAFIPSRVEDNTWLMQQDPNYIKRLEMLPEADKRAKLYGDWFSFAGQVFTEFRETRQDGEPDDALHVIEPFPIPQWWPKFAAIDWGHSAFTWIGWAAVSPKQRVYLYKEYHKKGMYVAEWANDFKVMSSGENLKAVSIDPSAMQKRGDPKTILAQFKEYSGYTPLLADNDRISGKMLMHEYFRWKQLPAVDGVEMQNENLPKLQVFRNCTNFIQAVQLAQYPPDGKGNQEDVMEWNPTEESPGDDPYDGGRYLIKLVDKWLKDPSIIAEDKTREEFDNAVKYLAETGDQTGFYRRMEHLERKDRNSNKPVKLFHRASAYRKSRGQWRVH